MRFRFNFLLKINKSKELIIKKENKNIANSFEYKFDKKRKSIRINKSVNLSSKIIKNTFFLFVSFFNLAKSFTLAGVKASRLDEIRIDFIDFIKFVLTSNITFTKWNLMEDEIINIGVIENENRKKLIKNSKLSGSKLFISDLDKE